MATNEHWMYQGRQYHQWFGHGTAPKSPGEPPSSAATGLFAPGGVGRRIDYAAASVIGLLPAAQRRKWEASLARGGRERLQTAVAAWHGASGLGRDAFRTRLLDPQIGDATVDHLRRASRGMVAAWTHAELGAAAADLAAAAQRVGLDRWPAFLAAAEHRAVAAAADGAIPGVVKASTAGTDAATAGAVLLGGLILYLGLRNLRHSPGAGTADPAAPTGPFIVENVPVPPPQEGETPTDVLKPSGQLVGTPGSGDRVRELPGGEPAAEELFDRITKGGTDATPPTYPGRRGTASERRHHRLPTKLDQWASDHRCRCQRRWDQETQIPGEKLDVRPVR